MCDIIAETIKRELRKQVGTYPHVHFHQSDVAATTCCDHEQTTRYHIIDLVPKSFRFVLDYDHDDLDFTPALASIRACLAMVKTDIVFDFSVIYHVRDAFSIRFVLYAGLYMHCDPKTNETTLLEKLERTSRLQSQPIRCLKVKDANVVDLVIDYPERNPDLLRLIDYDELLVQHICNKLYERDVNVVLELNLEQKHIFIRAMYIPLNVI